MNIALIAHDSKKELMVQFCIAYKAIFKKHNLKAPETYEELYNVCKQLKALYPDSYPFCTRSMSTSGSSPSLLVI